MPLLMDVHHKVDGLTAEALARAHHKELEPQGKYGVDYRQYWFDEGTGKVFCLAKTAATLVIGPLPGTARAGRTPPPSPASAAGADRCGGRRAGAHRSSPAPASR